MLIPRHITAHLRELSLYFPILSLTGPRQAGKTTLLKELYPDYRYVSLEDPDQQLRATEDPRSFLKHYDYNVIFDEAQRVPALFSYLQIEPIGTTCWPTCTRSEKLPASPFTNSWCLGGMRVSQ